MAESDNLNHCPVDFESLDPHAAKRWGIFLRKVGLRMTREGWSDPRRAAIVRSFGIPSLRHRLPSAATETQRARIWWREAVACSAGESEIPDLSEEKMYALNAFIFEQGEKFADPRGVRLRASRKPSAPGGLCQAPGCDETLGHLRTSARYCSRACQIRAVRSRTAEFAPQIA